MTLYMIVAMDQKGGIGKNNKLPWHLPEDLKLFKKITDGGVVIMGRKTHQSIGKRLPGRVNIVLTKDPEPVFVEQGCMPYSCLEEALYDYQDHEVFIIGGAQIYNQAFELDLVEHVLVSEVEGEYDTDTFFNTQALNEGFVLAETKQFEGFKQKIYDRRDQ